MSKFKHRFLMLVHELFFFAVLWWLSPWKPASLPWAEDIVFIILMSWVGLGVLLGGIWVTLSLALKDYG